MAASRSHHAPMISLPVPRTEPRVVEGFPSGRQDEGCQVLAQPQGFHARMVVLMPSGIPAFFSFVVALAQ